MSQSERALLRDAIHAKQLNLPLGKITKFACLHVITSVNTFLHGHRIETP
jgi:hypothetical protein